MNTDEAVWITQAHLELNDDTLGGFPSKRPYMAQKAQNTDGSYSNRPNRHDGQRKLLMSEIEFLTRVNTTQCENRQQLPRLLCVYAGACPCIHMDDLIDMFPNVYFVLVDPAFACKQNRNCQTRWDHKRVSVCPNLFDDRTVAAINDWVHGQRLEWHWIHAKLHSLDFQQDEATIDKLLFISDIRMHAHCEKSIDGDMNAQRKWFRELNAFAGLLKFRLPYATPAWVQEFGEDGGYEYLDGTVYLPWWGPRSTTECRLYIERGCICKKYKPLHHEQSMAGFNAYDRRQKYKYKQYDKDTQTFTVVEFASFDEGAEAMVLYNYRKCMESYGENVHPAYQGNILQRKSCAWMKNTR
jgi:hypothetical protein